LKNDESLVQTATHAGQLIVDYHQPALPSDSDYCLPGFEKYSSLITIDGSIPNTKIETRANRDSNKSGTNAPAIAAMVIFAGSDHQTN
jgi:hypothetical protein